MGILDEPLVPVAGNTGTSLSRRVTMFMHKGYDRPKVFGGMEQALCRMSRKPPGFYRQDNPVEVSPHYRWPVYALVRPLPGEAMPDDWPTDVAFKP